MLDLNSILRDLNAKKIDEVVEKSIVAGKKGEDASSFSTPSTESSTSLGTDAWEISPLDKKKDKG